MKLVDTKQQKNVVDARQVWNELRSAYVFSAWMTVKIKQHRLIEEVN